MPQAQVIQTREELPNPLATAIGSFNQRRKEVETQERDTDELAKIYEKYNNEGKNIDDAIMNLQTNPRLSPSRRVEASNTLLELKKQNVKIQKDIQKQVDAQKEAADQENYLRQAGADEEDIALFNALPQGGKTEVGKEIIEKRERKAPPIGLINEGAEDFDRGLTPTERVKRQDERFRIQTPLVDANSKSLSSLESEGHSIQLLNELNDSGEVAEGFSNININPKTGDLIIPKLATPEEQLFAKTINDFTVKAKDSYGGRVTNFELDKFMQRLPTLANSKEGRKLILEQMRIVNEVMQLEKRAVQQVIDRYGIRNIDYAAAERIGRENIKDQVADLRNQSLALADTAAKEEKAVISQLKAKVPEGKILMRTPQGKYMSFPGKNKKQLLEKGYKEL